MLIDDFSKLLKDYDTLLKLSARQVHLMRKMKKFPNVQDREALKRADYELGRFVDEKLTERKNGTKKLF